MPSVSANFCDDGFEWVEDVIKDGGELRYLCSLRWHGKCTSRLAKHSYYCSRHFNGRVFAIPLEHHVRAIRRFNDQRERTDGCGELKEYARVMCESYGLGDIVKFLERFHVHGGVLIDAVRDEFSRKTMPRDFQLTSKELVLSTVVPVVPRSWLPSSALDLLDHAEASSSVLLASAYVEWLSGRGKIHPEDFPGVAGAIGMVLRRLPTELGELVTRHLYGSWRLGPPDV